MAKRKATKEIERKFLLRIIPAKGILLSAANYIIYTTVYIYAGDPEVRVRKKVDVRKEISNTTYSLTVKFGEGLERDEFIVENIEQDFFRRALQKNKHSVVYKNRWKIKVGDLVWEVDKFDGRHAGLVMAEIELGEKDHKIYIPDFLDIEKEVTDDPRYYNKNLAVYGIPNPR